MKFKVRENLNEVYPNKGESDVVIVNTMTTGGRLFRTIGVN